MNEQIKTPRTSALRFEMQKEGCSALECARRLSIHADELEVSYQTVKDWAHRLESKLETIIDICDQHADGTVDATPLEKFANEIIGLSNDIDLSRVRTLQGEIAMLRQANEASVATEQSSRNIANNLRRELASKNADVALLVKALRAHHQHDSESCPVFFEQDGKPIELCTDLGEAYGESALAEQTVKALGTQAAMEVPS